METAGKVKGIPLNWDSYFQILKRNNIDPNFFCSEWYLTHLKAQAYINDYLKIVWVEEDGDVLFPPVGTDYKVSGLFFEKVWSDFGEPPEVPMHRPKFLDYEYIYDPKNFLETSGKKWQLWRKNCRKWRRRNPGWLYTFIPYTQSEEVRIAHRELLLDFFNQKDGNIDDSEVIAEYLIHGQKLGIYYKYLMNYNREIIGINIADWNYKYINYRYCLVKSGEPFLSEFMRYTFYMDPFVQESGKLVNDGGSLGNPGLERFKDRMNPIRKREVNSWNKIGGNLI